MSERKVVPRIATGAMERAGNERLAAYHDAGEDPDCGALFTIMVDAAPAGHAAAPARSQEGVSHDLTCPHALVCICGAYGDPALPIGTSIPATPTPGAAGAEVPSNAVHVVAGSNANLEIPMHLRWDGVKRGPPPMDEIKRPEDDHVWKDPAPAAPSSAEPVFPDWKHCRKCDKAVPLEHFHDGEPVPAPDSGRDGLIARLRIDANLCSMADEATGIPDTGRLLIEAATALTDLRASLANEYQFRVTAESALATANAELAKARAIIADLARDNPDCFCDPERQFYCSHCKARAYLRERGASA